MRTRATPPSTAVMAATSFACIPPDAVPSFISALARPMESSSTGFWSTSTPGTSLTSVSSSASMATAMAAAASSALTFSAGPSSSPTLRLTGDTTGK